ncbi:ATP-binding protein [Streptomyces sp. NBC_01340]|uniref:ATP-binding protein n=1 Tax=Streptomyces sp. NBC_01340 TaxID=2903830 RepID=UPI002E10F6E8|nr:ATP-binding protein [Streptomyces sp. NBC_01340]
MSTTTPQLFSSAHTFNQSLSATRRAARLARLLATRQLEVWQVPPRVTERAEQIVAELAAKAVLHGRVQGRDFRLALALHLTPGVLRIAVTDARAEQLPPPPGNVEPPSPPLPDAESGRGLLLVTALADRWGVDLTAPPLKTVWAELGCRPPHAPADCRSPRFTAL